MSIIVVVVVITDAAQFKCSPLYFPPPPIHFPFPQSHAEQPDGSCQENIVISDHSYSFRQAATARFSNGI